MWWSGGQRQCQSLQQSVLWKTKTTEEPCRLQWTSPWRFGEASDLDHLDYNNGEGPDSFEIRPKRIMEEDWGQKSLAQIATRGRECKCQTAFSNEEKPPVRFSRIVCPDGQKAGQTTQIILRDKDSNEGFSKSMRKYTSWSDCCNLISNFCFETV